MRAVRKLREEVRERREELTNWRLEARGERSEKPAAEEEGQGRQRKEEEASKSEGRTEIDEEEVKERERRRRERSLIWKAIKGEKMEDKLDLIKRILEKELGRKVDIKSATERDGDGGRKFMITELEEEERKKEMVWMRNGIWERWRVDVDEDLSKEERKIKWLIKGEAKQEKAEGKWVVYNNRRLWIEGQELIWDEKEGDWKREKLGDRIERAIRAGREEGAEARSPNRKGKEQ